MIHPVFPTPVGIYNIGSMTESEIDKMTNLPTHGNMYNLTSDDHYVLDTYSSLSVLPKITETLNQYLRDVYQPKFEVKAEITQSWINLTNKGHSHHRHRHPNSHISGVYYVSTTPQDKIMFINPFFYTWKLETDNYNVFNSQEWWFEAEQGFLILFPSTLEHYVNPVLTDTARISLSFNTVLRGHLGDERTLTYLKL